MKDIDVLKEKKEENLGTIPIVCLFCLSTKIWKQKPKLLLHRLHIYKHSCVYNT